MTFEEWWGAKTKQSISFNVALRVYGVDMVKPLVESAWILGREEGRKITSAMHSDGLDPQAFVICEGCNKHPTKCNCLYQKARP